MTFTSPIGNNRFNVCLDFVLAHETEYNADGTVRVERDKRDPGGTTKFGLDQRSHPGVDIAELTLSEARQIYFDDYWTPCKCGELIPPWDLAVFDAAVNVGKSRAIKWAQEVTHVEKDGFIGPKTVAAINGSTVGEFADYIERRQHYYKIEVRERLRQTYLKGWLARVADLREASKTA